jgi:hypothetical protein
MARSAFVPKTFTEVSCGISPSHRHAVPVLVWTRTTKEKSRGARRDTWILGAAEGGSYSGAVLRFDHVGGEKP